MTLLNRITAALVIIGALNWGLVGFFQFDLVAAIFGGTAGVVSRIIYALVGLSGVYQIFSMNSTSGQAGTLRSREEKPPHRRAA